MSEAFAEYREIPGISGRNPFLEALPPPLEDGELLKRLERLPSAPKGSMSPAERRMAAGSIKEAFIPLRYMVSVYRRLYDAIYTSYRSLPTVESIRRLRAVGDSAADTGYATSVESGSILGTPGVGKTSTIRRCLNLLPQSIVHMSYMGETMYCKQITYLFVECPADCSVKSLAVNILLAIDRAIGSEYGSVFLAKSRAASLSVLTAQVKRLCLTHHIGVIIVDEIQNVIKVSSKTGQERTLIRFLVEMTNECCTSIIFVGTPEAEALFSSREHLRRRTRGLRLLPFSHDGSFASFTEALLRYQYTPERARLTEPFLNTLYRLTNGVPAYIVQLLYSAQVYAIERGLKAITPEILKTAAEENNLAPRTSEDGWRNISDGSADEPVIGVGEPSDESAERKRTGRPPEKRDARDILRIIGPGGDALGADVIRQRLAEAGLLEVLSP